MKRILFLLLTLPVFANAQIFINTNPNSKDKSGTIVKESQKVDETKKELQTTKTEEQTIKTSLTSPNYKTTTTPVTTTTTTTPVTTTTKTPVTTTTTVTTKTPVTTTTSTPVKTNSIVGTPTSTSTNVSTNNSSSTTVTGNSATTTSYKSTATTSSYSANGNEDVPPNAEPGKCYARCQTEDQYGFNSKQVINTPKMTKRIKLPALYTNVYDTVVIRPMSTRTETIPAEYETIRQQKMVSPTTTKWIKGKADAGCLSADPNDCQVMCLVEVPAVYTTVTKRILKHEAYSRTITVPMEYKIVTKQVKTQNERYSEQVVPATYKTVQERYLITKGGYQGWREILCGADLTTSKITEIQKALKAAGFNPGPIDNIFGTQTKEALKAYQRAKGLPVGNLNLETLKSLGVN